MTVQEGKPDEAERAPDDGGRPSVWKSVFGSGKFLVSTVVVAVAAPWLWNNVRDFSRPPVLTTVTDDGGQVEDHSYALPEVITPDRLHELPPPKEFFADSPSLPPRAVKAGVLGSTITIEGSTSHDVVITDMRAEVLDEEPNVSGTYLHAPPQGGEPVLVFGFDLDEPDRPARVLEEGRLRTRYFADNAITLTDGEAVVIQLQAYAERAHYTWAIRMDLVIDGEPRSVLVQQESGPFEITGRNERYGAEYHWAGPDEWVFQDG